MTLSPAARRRCALLVAVAALALGVAGCSGDRGDVGFSGASEPREVVEAHVAAMVDYDLEVACELVVPYRRDQMAALDGQELEGYCERAVAEVVALADDDTRDRNRRIYTDPEITELERPGATWWRVAASDGSYTEDILLVEDDGDWWIERLESDVVADEHEGLDDGLDAGADGEETGAEQSGER